MTLQALAYRLMTGREGEPFFDQNDTAIGADSRDFITREDVKVESHPFLVGFAQVHMLEKESRR